MMKMTEGQWPTLRIHPLSIQGDPVLSVSDHSLTELRWTRPKFQSPDDCRVVLLQLNKIHKVQR